MASGGRPKFLARTSGGVCMSQSERRKVDSSEKRALVEDEEELAAVVAGALDGVRGAGGEEPKVAGGDVVDEGGAVGQEERDACVAGEHEGPLVGEVPVELAESAAGEAHVDAGDFFREGELALGDLVGPAAALDAAVGEVEGVPEGARRCRGRWGVGRRSWGLGGGGARWTGRGWRRSGIARPGGCCRGSGPGWLRWLGRRLLRCLGILCGWTWTLGCGAQVRSKLGARCAMTLSVEVSEHTYLQVERLSGASNITSAELIERAVSAYGGGQAVVTHDEGRVGLEAGFGLWSDMAEDGLAYQERLRKEWDREWDPK